jgi:hypothetical protein
VIKGSLGNAFREFGPAIFPCATALLSVFGIKDFMKFTFQTGFKNHLLPLAGK